ncbi:MAG: hypothetical protein IPI34_11105 [bacterium]|nr:hypothetical protein [bacterium]
MRISIEAKRGPMVMLAKVLGWLSLGASGRRYSSRSMLRSGFDAVFGAASSSNRSKKTTFGWPFMKPGLCSQL